MVYVNVLPSSVVTVDPFPPLVALLLLPEPELEPELDLRPNTTPNGIAIAAEITMKRMPPKKNHLRLFERGGLASPESAVASSFDPSPASVPGELATAMGFDECDSEITESRTESMPATEGDSEATCCEFRGASASSFAP